MKYISAKKLINIGFLIVIGLLCYLSLESYKSILRYKVDNKWVNHTNKVMESNQRLLSSMKDAEANSRGYFLLENNDFLDHYNTNRIQFLKESKSLKSLVSDNRSQQKKIDSIDGLAVKNFQILEDYITERKKDKLSSILTLPQYTKGKKIMDSIIQTSGNINDAEQQLLNKRKLDIENDVIRSQWLFFISIIITGVLIALIFLLLTREFKLKTEVIEELYNSNEWHAQTLISLGDGVIATSPNHQITYMNKAAEELTLFKSDEALSLPIEAVFDIRNQQTGQKVIVPTRRAIAQKGVVLLENHTILTRKDGSEFYIDDSAAPVYDANGLLLGAVLIFRNISEKTIANIRLKELNEDLEKMVVTRTIRLKEEIQIRKKAEVEKAKLIENLIETNKSLEQFIYIISHNFRRPVANIMGLLELIEENRQGDTHPEELNFLSTEVEHLDKVLKDLGNITSVLKNQTEHNEIVVVNEVLTVIIDSLEYEISKSDTQINNYVTSNDKLFCIKSYLNSIIVNLLNNAIKYKDPARPLIITINFSTDKNNDMLTIKDNGLGIDMGRYGDKIFGLYNRFHEHIEGKGLGLHISKTQMEMMGGKIAAQSAPGKGSEFTLYFPKYKKDSW